MTSQNERHDRLSSELVGSIERGEIYAAFQPQFSLLDGDIVGVEALCRWEHPALGEISPAEFIPIAEESALIDELGLFMLRRGCEAAARFDGAGRPIEVAVNVSLLQLTSASFETTLPQLLDELSIDAELLTLEITESTAIASIPEAVTRLERIHALGVDISIDDFGTENSSREQVLALPATELKLDQAQVRAADPIMDALLLDAVSFGHEQNLRLVAEGVETPEQLERVRALGVDRVQGFLLARPLPRKGVEAFLQFA